MEYEKWDEVLAPYNNAVEELKVKLKNIRKEFITKGEYSPIEFVTGRTKKIASIVSKAKRLNIQDIEAEMEDIAGIRIMCQFVEDIYNIVNLIKLRSDMTIVYEKDYIKNFKDSGYRSYHVIIKYPINSIAGSKEILCEIQIRTLAMNFWATIEHSLKYKYEHYRFHAAHDEPERHARCRYQTCEAQHYKAESYEVLYKKKEHQICECSCYFNTRIQSVYD